MNKPDYSLESVYDIPVIGIDEAGRGPWAGPVVASAVILSPDQLPDGINDSKKLSANKRERLFDQIIDTAQVGIGIADIKDIDTLNILGATKLAMCKAVEELSIDHYVALVDGNSAPALSGTVKTVIKGDSISLSIAAASIIAKVTRDRIMQKLALEYPGYGWERNAGYGTTEHQKGLATHGVTPYHRRSFSPIRKLLDVA